MKTKVGGRNFYKADNGTKGIQVTDKLGLKIVDGDSLRSCAYGDILKLRPCEVTAPCILNRKNIGCLITATGGQALMKVRILLNWQCHMGALGLYFFCYRIFYTLLNEEVLV